MVQSVSWVSLLYEKNYLVADVPGRFLVLYRSKIDLQTIFDAAISFYRLCAEFGLDTSNLVLHVYLYLLLAKSEVYKKIRG